MATRPVRINYTLYSPGYTRDSSLCQDFETLSAAMRRARGLGAGTQIVRNYNLEAEGRFDWWQEGRCWYFDGFSFDRIDLGDSKKWDLDPAPQDRSATYAATVDPLRTACDTYRVASTSCRRDRTTLMRTTASRVEDPELRS